MENTGPKIGVSLPTFGPHAGPEAVACVARVTEDLGFHGVSATERLLCPLVPTGTTRLACRNPMCGTPWRC